MKPVMQYAILDGANEPDLLAKLEELDPPVCCLYTEPIDAELIPLAPYLVVVTPEVAAWLKANKKPWGIYIESQSTLKELRKHIRKYLRVLLPDEEVPALLHFYDPRTIWIFLETLDSWQLHCFLGPIITVKSTWQNSIKEDDFAMIRSQYPAESFSKQLYLKIGVEQKKLIDDIYRHQYADELAEKMVIWHQEILITEGQDPVYTVKPLDDTQSESFVDKELDLEDFVIKPEKKYQKSKASNLSLFKQEAAQLLSYLQELNIKDERCCYGLAKLFVLSGCASLKDFSAKYDRALRSELHPGFFLAEKLLLDVLGEIPFIEKGNSYV